MDPWADLAELGESEALAESGFAAALPTALSVDLSAALPTALSAGFPAALPADFPTDLLAGFSTGLSDWLPCPAGVVFFACAGAISPGEGVATDEFTGGSVTAPFAMRCSESDITAAGVGSEEPCAVVIGAGGVGLGPVTTSGVVVLGRIG